MALTRKFLSALGIEPDKIDEIITAHSETVDGLKADRDKYKADAEKLPEVQKQLDAMKDDGGYKDKYESEHRAFEDYKSAQTAKETRAAKEKAVRAYFEGKNITGKNLEIAMRGCGAEIDAIELADGNIKSTDALDSLINGDFSGLVGKTAVKGAETSTPPGNATNAKQWTKKDIMAIKDTTERQKAWAEMITQERNK